MVARLVPARGNHMVTKRKAEVGADVGRRYYDIKGAANLLCVREWTVRTLVWRGELPYRRVGHKIILDAADIAAFMERGKKRNGL